MKTPPLLLGAALAFWGWQTGYLVPGLAGACVLEGSRIFPWRWSVAAKTVTRSTYLCNLILAGLLVYFLFGGGKSDYAGSLMSLLQLLPAVLFPLLLVQVYGNEGTIDTRALFLFRSKDGQQAGTPRPADLAFPYAGIALLSAALANNNREARFYAAFSLMTAWIFWIIRPKRSPLFATALLLLAVAAGYAGHVQLNRLQAKVEDVMQKMLIRSLTARESDPYRTKTAMGEIGSLQLSDEIVMRVKAPDAAVPFLLRSASYSTLVLTSWINRDRTARVLQPGPDGVSWDLRPAPEPERDRVRGMRIALELRNGQGLLPLPRETLSIAGVAAGELRLTESGVVSVDRGPEFAECQVRYEPGAGTDRVAETDREVPRAYGSLMTQLVKALGLRDRPVPQVLSLLKAYFQNSFQYSTYQEGLSAGSDALAEFLLRSRSGHCEYFAAATVLLLRSAGLPARYATGYVVQEFSPWEDAYIVRSRHSHAWAEVYYDGVWHDFDTTPATWFAVEQDRRSPLRAITDLWSWCLFKFSQWRSTPVNGMSRTPLAWSLIPLTIALLLRLYFTRRSPEKKDKRRRPVFPQKGRDSEFYALEAKIRAAGFVRNSWETLSSWRRRIVRDRRLSGASDDLRAVIALHYKYRFDPRGIDAEERAALKQAAKKIKAEVFGKKR